MIEIPFNETDQRRLVLAGGQITIKASGMPVFQFSSKEQFNKYVALKNKLNSGGPKHAAN
ncbi:hypothetical protein ACFFIX_06485 [Metabacillus herbersteinensis]|uniref:Uncharacterized protein n=1 Tax=Metabacillus herbersteinensis TaxID=283816 RepID=A0ABV6GBQ6_9BACI